MKLRAYQQRIVDTALSSASSAIICLPTGAGKTPVAAAILQNLLPRLRTKAVFLVPTVMLVTQQARALREWTPLRVIELCGEKRPSSYDEFDVLVSTPKAFQIAQTQHKKHLSWTGVGIVVFDEVHHVLKDHPYRVIAKHLPSSSRPLVFGLSASLTYAVEESKVRKALEALCRDLGVQAILKASEDEIEQEGYFAHRGAAEVSLGDVQIPAGVTAAAERKPHLMIQAVRERLRKNQSTTCTRAIYNCITAMESAIAATDRRFSSPIFTAGPKDWSEYALSRARAAAASASALGAERSEALAWWYEALRLLVVSWEEAEDLALAFIHMCGGFAEKSLSLWAPSLQASMKALNVNVLCAPRFEHLKQVLASKLRSGSSFRGLIFVQQRITTHILHHVLLADKDLAPKLTPACLYATSTPATPWLAVSRAESKARLEAFSSGSCNLLISTVVTEEGMDVAAANCVISFDAINNSVQLVQRRGRGRAADSSFVVLREREDRNIAMLEEVERQQQTFMAAFQPSAVNSAEAAQKEKVAQTSRVRGASELLRSDNGQGGDLARLILFCKKTKVTLHEAFSTDKRTAQWTCALGYQSTLHSATAEAAGATKKESRHTAAVLLLTRLHALVQAAA